MIRLTNGHSFEYMTASGAMGFDGRGWFWERPLVALGLIKLNLFTIVLRTLTREPRLYPVSNLSWVRPWTWLPWSSRSCVQVLPFGIIGNKVGLYNPGIYHWCEQIAPTMNFKELPYVGSIFGNTSELVRMTKKLNDFDLVGVEVNVSCPNTSYAMDVALRVVESVKEVKKASRHPVIVKLSVDQDYMTIARHLIGTAEAISLNSVPWATAFPNLANNSPFTKIGPPGSGNGGVSGRPAQKYNWAAVEALAFEETLPVIGANAMDAGDVTRLRELGASAISFGAIHLPDYPVWRRPWTIFTNPCKPTQIVERWNVATALTSAARASR